MSSVPFQPKLFSKLMTVFLVVWIIALFIGIQLVGVYVFTPYVLEQNNLSTVQRFALGSFNGTVTSYAMLLTLVVLFFFVFGMVFIRLITHRKKALKQLSKLYPNETSPQYKTERNDTEINEAEVHKTQINKAQKPEAHSSHHSALKNTFSYLAIRPFSLRTALVMFVLWAVFLVASEALTFWLNEDPSAFVDVLYESANPKWLLMLVMIVVAPIYEELMFRGILWSALKEQLKGKAGIWLASIITSLLFAVIHFQYDWYEMSVIFVLALLLSLARSKSGSLLLPIAIHIANNGIAMWQYLMFMG